MYMYRLVNPSSRFLMILSVNKIAKGNAMCESLHYPILV